MEFKGLYTALITPFTDAGELDIEGLIRLILLQNEAGVDGIVVLGTTGEAPVLNHDERNKVISTAVKFSKVPVIVGTGSNATAQAIEYTREAESLGAAAVLIVCPYYNKPTQEGLYAHYKAIHDHSSLPIMLYNVPGRSVVNLSAATALRLSNLERVKGIKEASGNLLQLSELIEKGSAHFPVLSGDDSLTLPAMVMGSVGVVSVLSNLFPLETKLFVDQCLEGSFEEARVFHHASMPLVRALFAETNPILVKEAMNLLKLPAGPCRLPLTGGSVASVETLQEALTVYHHRAHREHRVGR